MALYEALYGARPFEGVSLGSSARPRGRARVSRARARPKVPAWLRRAVLRGLRPRPEERFPSMEALLEALVPGPSRVRTWVAVSAAVACLLGVAMGYVVAHRREVRCAQEAQKLDAAWGPGRRERVRAAFLATDKPYAAAAWEKLSAALDEHASLWRSLRTESCLAADEGSSGLAWQTAACLDARLWQFAAVTEVLEKADAQTVQNVPSSSWPRSRGSPGAGTPRRSPPAPSPPRCSAPAWMRLAASWPRPAPAWRPAGMPRASS